MSTDYRVANSLEWLNENMHRNYPILDSVVPVSVDGTHLPSSLLVDLSMSCVAAGEIQTNRFYVSHVNRTGSGIQVVISYYNNGAGVPCAQTPVIPVDINAGMDISQRTFQLSPYPSIPDELKSLRTLEGSVIIGSCMDVINGGSYVLSYENGAILSTLIRIFTSGLESISFVDQAGNTVATWTDDFTLQAGEGIDFEYNADTNSLIIYRTATEAESNAPFKSVAEIVAELNKLFGSPIMSVNGISGNNISIIGGDCTKIDNVSHGIVINNPCSVPCCKSSDTADIEAALQTMEDAKTRLLNYFTALTTNINAIQSRLSSLIASRG